MYLFFDTETTGLPISWNAPISDLTNWPRVVQIAWLLYDKSGNEISSKEYIIKPENYFIPHDSAKVHGITTDIANEKGIELKAVLNEFGKVLKDSKYLIAHNINFDHKIISAEFLRKKISSNISQIKKICTMESSADFCKIPGGTTKPFKYPKLSELHFKLFNHDFKDAHDAMVDVKACAKCFFELQKLNIIPNHEEGKKQDSFSFAQGVLF